MVITERLEYLRSQVVAGHALTISILPNPALLKVKYKLIMSAYATPCCPLIVMSTCDALERLTSLCSICVSVDRGHMHSDGRYEVAVWLSEAPSVASSLTMPRFPFQNVVAPESPTMVPGRPPSSARGLNVRAQVFQPASRGEAPSLPAVPHAPVDPPLLRNVLASVLPTAPSVPAGQETRNVRPRLEPVPEVAVATPLASAAVAFAPVSAFAPIHSTGRLRLGQHVTLEGLVRRADLNGRRGTVTVVDQGDGRYGIRVGNVSLSIRHANLSRWAPTLSGTP